MFLQGVQQTECMQKKKKSNREKKIFKPMIFFYCGKIVAGLSKDLCEKTLTEGPIVWSHAISTR